MEPIGKPYSTHKRTAGEYSPAVLFLSAVEIRLPHYES